MGTSKDNLIEEIDRLKNELKEAKKHTYIYETHHLQVWDGELHVGFGDYPNNEKFLVWNVESLLKDLPFIITQVAKENKKMQKMYIESIINTSIEIKKALK